jgi:pimeloyl-ACP methyl ester carboxylesterase
MSDIAPENRIHRIKVPILLIHGDDDHYLPQSHMETLYARANHESARCLLISHRGHHDILRDSGCGDAVVAFFRETLSAFDTPDTLNN